MLDQGTNAGGLLSRLGGVPEPSSHQQKAYVIALNE